MFAYSTLCMALVGICIAIPLESPSSDPVSPMLIEPEPSPAIQPADQSEQLPNLEPFNMELEPSSDVEEYFEPRIIGGTDAPQTKYMIALVIGWHLKSFICGGSVMTKRHVITAAHCIYKDWNDGSLLESYHGIIGSNTWNHGGDVLKFISYLEHPEYNTWTMKYDCAVIKTEEILFNHNVHPIRIESKWIGPGVRSHATGWGAQEVWGGAADVLQILPLQTISEKECLRLIRDHAGEASAALVDYKVEICGFHSRGHGMCFGDSGSALVANKRLIALVSWGFPCANGVPDIFVRVSPMIGWLESVVNHK